MPKQADAPSAGRMHPRLSVLLIEDSDDDAVLVERALRTGGYAPDVTRVETEADMRAALAGPLPDVIVSDFTLPTFGATGALEVKASLGIDVPFIVVSGTVGEEVAVSAMRAGAQDFIVKSNLSRLVPAIRRETAEAERRREHSLTQRALRDTSAMLGAVFASSPAAIFMTDEHDRVEIWNPASAEIFGVPDANVLGRELDSTAFGAGELFAEMAYRVRQGEDVTARELDWRVTEHQNPRRLSVSAAPLASPVDSEGAATALRGIVWVVLDVSERHRLEQQLEHAHRLEAVGRLAGGIAHDFNNILTAITGYSDFLLEGLPHSLEEMRADVLEIRTAAQRATRLTHQLLAFSRRQVMQPHAIDLNAIVLDVESMLRRVMGDQVYIETRLEAALPPAWADRGQIEQILLNLVVNARDAVADGGTITITTSRAPDDRPDELLQDAGYVVLEVCDDGAGMEPELVARIFEPFFTTKPAGKGTGLGLSTVYGIVQQSEGHIDVDSRPGAGTSFRVWLRQPERQAERAGEAEPGPHRMARGPRRSLVILLVEDEPSVRAVAARTLARAGHTVLQADSGAEAMRLASETRVELLVSDVMMTGMSGPALAQRMRDHWPDLPAIFMSGYAEEDIPHDAVMREGENFLEKPFTPDALLHAVDRVMSRSGAAGRGA